MNISNTMKIYRHACLRMLLAFVVIIVGASHKAESAEAYMRRRLPHIFQQSDDLARKAIEASKRGDVTTSRQNLDQIDTLSPHPRIKAAIQNSPLVQEAKKAHVEGEQAAIRVAAQKAEEEKRAKKKEIAARIAFEQEAAQRQIAQLQEDERKAVTRQQQQSQIQAQIPQPIQPTPQTHTYQDGRAFSTSLLGNVIGAAKSTNPQDIPGFETDKPREASLNVETIGDEALAESRSNQTAQHIHAQAQDRQSFKIDPNTDPLFKDAAQVIANPQRALNEEIREIATTGGASEEIKTCEEGGDEYSQTCSKHLEIVLKITPEVRTPYRYCPAPGHPREKFQRHGFNSGYITVYEQCGGCTNGVHVTPKKVEILREQWVDRCTVLEDLAEKGLCRYESKTTSPLNETRTIQVEPILRDHFEEHYTYACFKKASSNSCAGLREQGCFQIKSLCKETVGGSCVLWEQTYSCPSQKPSIKSYQASNKENSSQTSLFCLTGNCVDTSYEANGELLNVMSQLSALREAQNDLRNFNAIFKGQHRWCTRNCLDFRDCCGSGKGWGVSLHLSSCDAQEIELSTLRDKNLCIQVGTYCAEKHLGVCTRKKTSFCCFGTKMARLIQQNGRAQLGMGFGDPKSPDCNGLSAEQLSQIDFSKINFSEIFEDIKKQTVSKTESQSLAQVSAERLQNNMTLLTKPTTNQKSTQEKQKLKENGL